MQTLIKVYLLSFFWERKKWLHYYTNIDSKLTNVHLILCQVKSKTNGKTFPLKFLCGTSQLHDVFLSGFLEIQIPDNALLKVDVHIYMFIIFCMIFYEMLPATISTDWPLFKLIISSSFQTQTRQNSYLYLYWLGGPILKFDYSLVSSLLIILRRREAIGRG